MFAPWIRVIVLAVVTLVIAAVAGWCLREKWAWPAGVFYAVCAIVYGAATGLAVHCALTGQDW